MSAFLMSSCNWTGKKAKKTDISMKEQIAFDPQVLPEDPVFEIQTTKGNMVVRLYKETPLHRDNFVKLASERYYDGILFHRVIRDFMIQCGDPQSRTAAPGERLGSEVPVIQFLPSLFLNYTTKKELWRLPAPAMPSTRKSLRLSILHCS